MKITPINNFILNSQFPKYQDKTQLGVNYVVSKCINLNDVPHYKPISFKSCQIERKEVVQTLNDIIAINETALDSNFINLVNKILSNGNENEIRVIQGTLVNLFIKCERGEDSSGQIKLCQKVLSNPILCNETAFPNNMDMFLNATNEDIDAQIELIDKFLSDERLLYNSVFHRSLFSFIYDQTKESVPQKMLLLDAILADENLYRNTNFMNKLPELLNNKSKANVKGQIDFLQKISSDENLYTNKLFMSDIFKLLSRDLKSEQKGKVYKLLDKVLAEEALYSNENIINNLSSALLNISEDDSDIDYAIKVLDLYVNDRKLQKNKFVPSEILDIATATNNEMKFNVANKFLNSRNLYKQEEVVNSFDTVLKNINDPIVEEFVMEMFTNEQIKQVYMQDAVLPIMEYKKPEEIKQKTLLLRTISNNEDMKRSNFCNRKNILFNILKETNTEEQRLLIERILGNKNIQKSIQDIYPIMTGINYFPEYIKVLNKIFDNEELYLDYTIRENFFEYSYDEIVPVNETEEQILDVIFSNKELYTCGNLINSLGELFKNTREDNNSNSVLVVLNKLLSDDKKYLKNPLLVENMARIVSNSVKSEENFENVFDFCDFVLSDKKYYENKNAKAYFWQIIPCLCSKENSDTLKTIFKTDYLLNYRKEAMEYSFNPDVILLEIIANYLNLIETPEQRTMLNKILTEEDLYKNDLILQNIKEITERTKSEEDLKQKFKIIDLFLSDKRLSQNYDSSFLYSILSSEYYFEDFQNYENIKEMVNIILSDERLIGNENVRENIDSILIYSESILGLQFKKNLIDKIFKDEKLYKNKNVINNLGKILSTRGFANDEKIIDKIFDDEKYYNNKLIMDNVLPIIGYYEVDSQKQQVVEEILSSEIINTSKTFMNNLGKILGKTNSSCRREVLMSIWKDEELINSSEFISSYLDFMHLVNENNVKSTLKYIELYKQGEITGKQIGFLLRNEDTISFNNIRYANKIMGRENLDKLSKQEEELAYKFVRLYQKENINELSTDAKRSLLKKLVAANDSLFETEEEFQKMFPLLPKNKTEYCEFLPAIVSSIGIETATLNKEKEENFATSLSELSSSLKSLSDEDYTNLTLEQEYTKQDFFNDVYPLIKDLDKNKRQKIYDYFGFEFHHNKKGSIENEKGTKYSITGYPANLHNGKKLAQIKNEQVKKIIEQVRPLVVKFSENNKIHSNNKEIEKAINEVAKVFPEIRTLIGKQQHATHDFDIIKHSLKVMQKMVQNPNFDKLNDSDKNILLIASLIHDCTKKEGERDSTHAIESAFDCFYIIQKLNLTNDEKIKLYSLVKHHEWLGDINKTDENNQSKKIKSIAYDLHYGNLFELAKIFTEADLKAVKNNDDFFNRYNNDFCEISKKIEELITELKKSQPLLPITKLPSASRIKEAITIVREDYSTNLKGIYQDEKGMVIIKFNEVENETWEKIGFPKGSISRGIMAKNSLGSEVNTGNIKFFVHGLDSKDNLRKFDAFALPDSDALLSVSYTERPESKFRFYRNQGVIINTDSKYIHGGGQTDRGSGCGKNIDDFKEKYAYENGKRHSDRLFVSNLIKEYLDVSDDEYKELVEKNMNKPLCEIEPKEIQEKIVKALATINSHTRYGERNYNEMYLSNPEVMGVFAYNRDNMRISYVKGFVDNQANFLKEYALEKDVPFVIFGE